MCKKNYLEFCFSSRRRHTRSYGDWSSDVCSSDLDELGQVLTGLKMEVTWLAKRLREKPLIEKTDSMCKLIDTTVQTVRKIATGLRPEMLDDMGLIAAVGWQAKEFQKRTGIRCRAKLPPEV